MKPAGRRGSPSHGRVVFVVQELDGYTNGRPSWLKVGAARNREDAEKKMADHQAFRPLSQLRIRQVRRP